MLGVGCALATLFLAPFAVLLMHTVFEPAFAAIGIALAWWFSIVSDLCGGCLDYLLPN